MEILKQRYEEDINEKDAQIDEAINTILETKDMLVA